jgi:hypothetical protein
MPQQAGVSVENSFINGVITEATGLNFPDKACTEAYDVEFDIDGSVYRRPGFDLETNYTTKVINKDNKVINTYLWQNVSGNGNVTVIVMQVGNKLYFYYTEGTGVFSTGAISDTVTLTPVSGAPVVDTVEAQFTDGNGYLIVTHPYCDPIRITYDEDANTVTAETIVLKIRDFEGAIADPNAVDSRPTTTLAGMNVSHAYNLYNQGWTTANLTAWDTAQTTMPSNADVMWRFKDSSDNFDASDSSIARITSGNTPAPNGHYILSLSDQDRNTASGLTGVASTTTSFQRPGICAFFAGRVFYAGINYVGFNSNVYFTQILERVDQYGSCYQVNDPTSEDLFDLLPTDGGVISIPEAGTIHKMHTVPGGLCLFAANGVWFITGSTGLGFTATDYTVQKIADISTISPTSFVNVDGYPMWWNEEGIYAMSGNNTTIPSIKSLTYGTIKTFYDDIPVTSKRYARGFYHKTTGLIRWVYRSTSTSQINDLYEYDRVLNHNARTAAFYPWTISDSPIKVCGIISSELITRPISIVNVVDSSGNPVVDSGGNQVIAFTESGSQDQQFDKYLVTYPDGSGSWNFTFADRDNEEYVDWFKYDGLGVSYDSYFISGFKLQGQGIRKFQNNWIRVYSRLDKPVQYRFQGIWDFANTGSSTGRWSTNQLITHDNLNYSNDSRRLKVRGHGEALQFRVSSLAGKFFDIIGWSSFQTGNAAP